MEDHHSISPDASYILQWSFDNSFPEGVNSFSPRSDSLRSNQRTRGSAFPEPLNIPHRGTSSSPSRGSPNTARPQPPLTNAAWPPRSDSATTRSTSRPEPEQEGRPLDSPVTGYISTNPAQTSPPRLSSNHIEEDGYQAAHLQHSAQEQHRFYNREERNQGYTHHSICDTTPNQEDYSLRPPLPENEPSRSLSAASKTTFQQANSLFRDFDGVHRDSEDGNSFDEEKSYQDPKSLDDVRSFEDGESVQNPEQKEFLNSLAFDDVTFNVLDGRTGQPSETTDLDEVDNRPEEPPEAGMVYYPAPVPMNLNVPKRLSQQTPASLIAKRQSEVLGSLPADLRRSMVWSRSGLEADTNENSRGRDSPDHLHSRDSKTFLANRKLPPQLRASVFFGQQSVYHELEIKNGSAVATLEEMLDASATTPAGGFGDLAQVLHSEDVGWRPKKPKRSTLSNVNDINTDGRRSRASLVSSKRSSNLHQRSASQLSYLSGPNWNIAEADEENKVEADANADEATPLHQSDNEEEDFAEDGGDDFPDGDFHEHEDAEEEDEYDEYDEDEEPQYAAPTTLLAELQLRKEQLKQRNRTAATAFPNGMHSTLLELDAVAQIEKKKRKGQRTALAWEDPSDPALTRRNGPDDDDMPLGILFPGQKGLVKKDQPIGLLAKREMDDNEPLSRRRNRLKGDAAKKAPAGVSPLITQQVGGLQERGEDDSPHEGETLAQRTRRLKTKKALDDAIGDAGSKENGKSGGSLESEFISQFGGQERNSPKATNGDGTSSFPNAVPGQEEEETLGQRRRRLQLESQGKGNALGNSNNTSYIPLHATQSLANLLAANPISGTRNFSNENGNITGTGAGLIGASEQMRAERKQAMEDQKLRSTSAMVLDVPLLGTQDAGANKPVAELRGQLKEATSRGGLDTQRYNDGNGGGTNINLVDQTGGNLHNPGQILKQEPQLRGQLQAAMSRPNIDTGRYNDGNGGGFNYVGLVEQTPVNMQTPGQMLKAEPHIRGQLHAAHSRSNLASSNLTKFNDGTGGLATQRATSAGVQQQQQQQQLQLQMQQQQYHAQIANVYQNGMNGSGGYANGMTNMNANGMNGHTSFYPMQSMYATPQQMQMQGQMNMVPAYPQYNPYLSQQPMQMMQPQQATQPAPYEIHYAHLQQMQTQPLPQSATPEPLAMTTQQRANIENWRQSVQ